MPRQFTTGLPDEDQPLLGNGVEDEIAVDRESAPTNYGDVRIQIRETGASSWDGSAAGFGEFIGAFDTITMEFVGREDGERYEVRARTETEHVTGGWTEPVAITTQFPGATALTMTAAGTTTVDLAWTDNADNETGQRVIRERQRADGTWRRQRVVADAGVDAETFTDDTAQPDRTYRYRVEPYTEHTSAQSDTVTATTDALAGVRDRRVAARGWTVEVDHPSGDTLRPTVLEGAEWRPRLKAKPQVRIPVPKSDTWEAEGVEGSTIRAWKHGTRLPIGEVRSVEREEGQGGTRDVIIAAGGVALDDDVEGIEYPEEDAHIAAEEVITDELGWVANVDDPQTSAREDVRIYQASDSADFSGGIEGESGGDPFPATSPLTVQDNEVYAEATGWFQEAEDADGGGVTNTTQGGEWSDGQAVELRSGDSRTFDLDTEHTIPQGELYLTLVYAIPSDTGPGLEVTVDVDGGSEIVVESFGEGGLNPTGGDFDLAAFEVLLTDGDVGDLPPGNHSVEVGIPVTSGGEMLLDFVHQRDDRFSYDLGDTTPVDGVVTGWQQHPADVDVVFEPISSVEQVVAGQLDVEMATDQGPVALGLRNDTTASWTEGSGTSFATDFASPSQLLQARVTLGREDSGSQSGQFGDVPHRLDFLNLYADLVNTPVLIDFVHRGSILDLLNRIADAGNFIWELRRASESADAEYRIEWTQPGQRVADREPTLVSYQGRRTIEGSYQRVIAEGKTARVEAETVTTNDYGLNVGLDEGPVDAGSETVYDVGDRSSTYERNIDYTIGHSEGTLTILEGGSMSPDTDYQIDYEWRYEGRYAQPGVADPNTLREQFPDATSDRECEQLALAVVREVAAPLEEAEVTIREDDPDRPLVASIPADRLPFEGPLKVREVSADAREVTLTLGSRESAGDVVDNFNDRLSAVARNV
ncbi:hypothetical protein ACFPM1_07795 [Halorubrum rubrum]|uniref:Fibronectin type-III domain-containing protein n=1 Tax=Halorubrum rubrum TaxID=1126240 RepID=A0ABD5R1H0_9EURY|nr:hypothetical protein [Halorubrum rubrum]